MIIILIISEIVLCLVTYNWLKKDIGKIYPDDEYESLLEKLEQPTNNYLEEDLKKIIMCNDLLQKLTDTAKKRQEKSKEIKRITFRIALIYFFIFVGIVISFELGMEIAIGYVFFVIFALLIYWGCKGNSTR